MGRYEMVRGVLESHGGYYLPLRVTLPLLSKLFAHPSSSKRPLTASGVPEPRSCASRLKFHLSRA